MNSTKSNYNNHKNLTPYPSGSLRELWMISFPLMLSLMSGSLMLFWDRILLAQFSIEAHNAATSSGTIVTFLQFAFICTTCIAEVFVGRYYGANQPEKIGIPIWQMIWLSVFSIFIFTPLGFFAGDYIFASSPYFTMENDYFFYMMCFGPIFCVNCALSSFYIGRGRVKFITAIMIGANLLNIPLAYALIFGFEPYLPPLGISGAAIAAGMAQLIQALILFLDFVKTKNRKLYGTGCFHFNRNEFFECIRLGLPSSLAHTLEILAWALFFRMLMSAGEEHLTVVSIAQSIFFLFTFLTEGVSKGAQAIAANMIGARKWDDLWKLLHSGIKFYLFLFCLFGTFLMIDSGPLVKLFISEDSVSSEKIHELVASSCLWVWIFFLFDGIHWLVVGLLTAAGDTKFILKLGGSSIWIFALLPTYFFIVLQGNGPDVAWAITAFYGLVTCSLYLARFYSTRWKKNLVLEQQLVQS
ncbi:MAG: MATE family efflux transporter [Parachlamydiaceae bacterium]|nr:MATE family efflux transporter [Parachlamydiaceae bacterium]